jgi:hypothetical protein
MTSKSTGINVIFNSTITYFTMPRACLVESSASKSPIEHFFHFVDF